MRHPLLARTASSLITLWVLVTVAFFMMRLAPGGPFDSDQALPPAVEANLRAAYQLDAPLHRQYLDYMGRLLRGDLGPSFRYPDRSVNELVAAGAGVSITLGLIAIVLATTLGVALGFFAALRRDGFWDHLLMSAAMVGLSVPTFVVAPLLILVFALWLGWAPPGGWAGGEPARMVLPVITLALPPLAYAARLARGSLLDVLSADFVRTARAKGLSERRVVLHHCLRPALLPVVSWLGPAVAAIVTGSVVVEQVFGLPGLGRYFIQGGLNRDYTLVLGVVVLYGALIILMNLLVDLAYRWLDPRVRGAA